MLQAVAESLSTNIPQLAEDLTTEELLFSIPSIEEIEKDLKSQL